MEYLAVKVGPMADAVPMVDEAVAEAVADGALERAATWEAARGVVKSVEVALAAVAKVARAVVAAA